MRAGAFLLVPLLLLAGCARTVDEQRPADFVALDQVLTRAIYEVRYFRGDNFVGTRIDGYQANRVLLTSRAATALYRLERELDERGLRLKLFDGYRPQRAVEHFRRWANNPDTHTQAAYYPGLSKPELFRQGYIARHSGHSRGSTVDLTLVDSHTGQDLDMGSPFDFFGPLSHQTTTLITPNQRANRQLLRGLMERYGFEAYEAEWWHYRLKEERYPRRYFDFVVE